MKYAHLYQAVLGLLIGVLAGYAWQSRLASVASEEPAPSESTLELSRKTTSEMDAASGSQSPKETDLEAFVEDSEEDPLTAVTRAIESGLAEEDFGRLADVFKRLAEVNPEAALKAAQAIEGDQALQTVLGYVIEAQPETAYQYLRDHDPDFSQAKTRLHLMKIGKRLAKEGDVESVTEWIAELKNFGLTKSQHTQIATETAKSMVTAHPERAMEFLEAAQVSAFGRGVVWRQYAEDDWHAAYSSADSVKDEWVIQGLIGGLGKQGDEMVLSKLPELLDRLGDHEIRFDSGLFSSLEDESVLALWQQYPDKLDSAATSWASKFGRLTDPQDDVGLIASMPESQAKSFAIQHATKGWAQEDPEAAAHWLLTEIEGVDQSTAYRNLINNWARYDRVSAREWLESQPTSDARDAGMKEFAALNSVAHPSDAVAISQSIANDEQRDRATEIAFRAWLWQDAQQAQNEMRRLDLSPKLQARLEQKVREYEQWKQLADE